MPDDIDAAGLPPEALADQPEGDPEPTANGAPEDQGGPEGDVAPVPPDTAIEDDDLADADSDVEPA